MTLSQGHRYLVHYTGLDNGIATYVVGSDYHDPANLLTQNQRYQSRYVGKAEDGLPVYLTAPCTRSGVYLPVNRRYQSRYVGKAEDGLPVYAASCAPFNPCIPTPCSLVARTYTLSLSTVRNLICTGVQCAQFWNRLWTLQLGFRVDGLCLWQVGGTFICGATGFVAQGLLTLYFCNFPCDPKIPNPYAKLLIESYRSVNEYRCLWTNLNCLGDSEFLLFSANPFTCGGFPTSITVSAGP